MNTSNLVVDFQCPHCGKNVNNHTTLSHHAESESCKEDSELNELMFNTYKKIWFVYSVSLCDEYDDEEFGESIAAFSSQEKANEFVQKLNQLNEFNTVFMKREENEFQSRSQSSSPIKEPARPIAPQMMKDLQLLCSQGKVSQEIKELSKKLQAEHMRNIKQYEKNRSKWFDEVERQYKTLNEEKTVWREANYILPEHLKSVHEFLKKKSSPLGNGMPFEREFRISPTSVF